MKIQLAHIVYLDVCEMVRTCVRLRSSTYMEVHLYVYCVLVYLFARERRGRRKRRKGEGEREGRP